MFFNAEAYERIMGRWSRQLAPVFLKFAGVGDGDRVLDVGCGTGSLALAAAAAMRSSRIVGVDPSAAYIEHARTRTADGRVTFQVADAQALPFSKASYDASLALLVLNFIPDARRAVREMRRVTRPGGRTAACVWDYSDGMTMLRVFWDTAVALDPDVAPRHEGHMPYCKQGQLAALWSQLGLQQVEEVSLVIRMAFASFDDFWAPFLEGQGPAASYATALPLERQAALRERLRGAVLDGATDRPLTLDARAWAVRGVVGG